MMTNLAQIYIGIEAPKQANKYTRWISQSAQHLTPPLQPGLRTIITGTGEPSPWWNPILNRYECLYSNGTQYFQATRDIKNWPAGIKVLGTGSGGESGNAVQCSVYIENNKIYALYLNSGGVSSLHLAVADMPENESDIPIFSKLGTIYTPASGTVGDSPWLMKINESYVLFTHNNRVNVIATTAASRPEDFVAQPFTELAVASSAFSFNIGGRVVSRVGRPQVFFDNGTYTMFGHILGVSDLGASNVYRWTSQDSGIPFNWTLDPISPFLDKRISKEVDQQSNFRLLYGPAGNAFGFWTASDNYAVGGAFYNVVAPMTEPIMAHDGYGWHPSFQDGNQLSEKGLINPDALTADTTLINMWDASFWTDTANKKATFPTAAPSARIAVANVPDSTDRAYVVTLAPANTTDRIFGGIPITAMSSVGTTCTVTTKRPHGRISGDIVTVTGATPAAYNVTAAAITVIDSTTFTYTAGSSPGANTKIGCYDWALDPGEVRHYKCRRAGFWARD